jgi:hypothetical protein
VSEEEDRRRLKERLKEALEGAQRNRLQLVGIYMYVMCVCLCVSVCVCVCVCVYVYVYVCRHWRVRSEIGCSW